MVVAWTESFQTVTTTGTGWQTYNLNTLFSIPAGAVVCLFFGHNATTSAHTMGCRTGGSSLARTLKVHEAEGTGFCACSMWVKTSGTGTIDIYVSSTTACSVGILGWLTGADFTELYEIRATAGTGVWTSDNLLSSLSIPANSVISIAYANHADGAACEMGARTGGTSAARTITIHEAESAGADTTDCTTITASVKSSNTGTVEFYEAAITDGKYYTLGYFNNKIDYVQLTAEAANRVTSPTVTTTWQSRDVSSLLDGVPRLLDVFMFNVQTAATTLLGVREGGSSIGRGYTEHEAETNGWTGSIYPTNTNGSGSIEVYSGAINANVIFGIYGYYKFIDSTTISVTDTFGFSDALGPLNRTLPISDSFGFSEVIQRGYIHLITDNFTSTDALGNVNKTLIISDDFNFTENIERGYVHRITDDFGFTDVVTVDIIILKIVTDSFAFNDALGNLNKTIIIPDSFAHTDAVERGYVHLLTDTFGFVDVSAVPQRSIFISDDFVFTDSVNKINVIIITDGMGFTEAVDAIEGGTTLIFVSDAFGFSESLSFNKTLIIEDAFDFSEALIAKKIRLVSDDFGFTDSINRNWTVKLTDNFTASDNVERGYVIVVTDAFNSTDNIFRNLTIKVVDDFGMTDGAEVYAGYIVRVTDTFSINDIIVRNKIVLLEDHLNFLESVDGHLLEPAERHIDFYRWMAEYKKRSKGGKRFARYQRPTWLPPLDED